MTVSTWSPSLHYPLQRFLKNTKAYHSTPPPTKFCPWAFELDLKTESSLLKHREQAFPDLTLVVPISFVAFPLESQVGAMKQPAVSAAILATSCRVCVHIDPLPGMASLSHLYALALRSVSYSTPQKWPLLPWDLRYILWTPNTWLVSLSELPTGLLTEGRGCLICIPRTPSKESGWEGRGMEGVR